MKKKKMITKFYLYKHDRHTLFHIHYFYIMFNIIFVYFLCIFQKMRLQIFTEVILNETTIDKYDHKYLLTYRNMSYLVVGMRKERSVLYKLTK